MPRKSGLWFRYTKVAAGLLACLAAGALASIALTFGGSIAAAAYYYSTGTTTLTTITTTTTTTGPAPVATIPAVEHGIPHVLLCSPVLVMRADGTLGIAFEVEFSEWRKGASYIPAGSMPAKYAEGIGLTCDNLPSHALAGYLVDGEGTDYGPLTPFITSAVYPYWFRK
jgi:hypothetical protein